MSRRPTSFLRASWQFLSPFFSHSCALHCKERSPNSFASLFLRTLCKNTGAGGRMCLLTTTATGLRATSAAWSRRSRAKADNFFRIRTCKNEGLRVLQNEHFKKKRGEGVVLVRLAKNLSRRREQASKGQTTT